MTPCDVEQDAVIEPDICAFREDGESIRVPTVDPGLSRRVEAFLYWEAELLDTWRLDDWSALFAQEAVSQVPALGGGHDSPANSLFLIADDLAQIRSRARQLLGPSAWIENPRSKTCRLITNIRIADLSGDEIDVKANFMIHRSKWQRTDTYVGSYKYKLVVDGDRFKIISRIAILAQDSLTQGHIGFIL